MATRGRVGRRIKADTPYSSIRNVACHAQLTRSTVMWDKLSCTCQAARNSVCTTLCAAHFSYRAAADYDSEARIIATTVRSTGGGKVLSGASLSRYAAEVADPYCSALLDPRHSAGTSVYERAPDGHDLFHHRGTPKCAVQLLEQKKLVAGAGSLVSFRCAGLRMRMARLRYAGKSSDMYVSRSSTFEDKEGYVSKRGLEGGREGRTFYRGWREVNAHGNTKPRDTTGLHRS